MSTALNPRSGEATIHRSQAVRALGPIGLDWISREQPTGELSPDFVSDTGQLSVRLADYRGPKTVVFVAKKAYFNQLRTSMALRRRGWRTVAVVLDTDVRSQGPRFFDDVVSTDLRTFLDWWSGAEDCLVHSQSWLFRNHVPTLIDAFRPPSCRHVVEMMDLNSFMFPLSELQRSLEPMKTVWGQDCETNHRIQIDCHNYLATHSDGVIFPGGKGHQRELGIANDVRTLNYMSYPLRDFFSQPDHPAPSDPKDTKLVFVGGVPTSEARRTPAIFGDAQLLSVVDRVHDSGMSLDVYNNPLIAPPSRYQELYPEHTTRAAQRPDYQFRAGEVPWKLGTTLGAYDLGLMLYDFKGLVVGEPHFEHLVPTKLFTYLEAGLPVLVSDRWKAVLDIIEEYGIGRAVSAEELDRLPQVVEQLDLEQLRRNVLAARDKLSMDVQVQRLEELYAYTWQSGGETC